MFQNICIILSVFLFFPNMIFLPHIFPQDAAGGNITIISNPFARSLPDNPMFGPMSHAPHLPRWGAARGPFIYTGQQTPTIGGYHSTEVGGGVFNQDRVGWQTGQSWNQRAYWVRVPQQNELFHPPGGFWPTLRSGLVSTLVSPV